MYTHISFDIYILRYMCVCVCVCVCMLSLSSHSSLFVTLWTLAHQSPPSMGFPRQEYWSGLSFPSPGNLPNAGIEPVSVSCIAGRFFIAELPGKPHIYNTYI